MSTAKNAYVGKQTLRPADVAERWDCSERHVRHMLDRGELPFFRLGEKLIRISLEDVEEYERCQRKRNIALASTEEYTASSSPMKQARADVLRLVRRTRQKPSES